MTDSTPTIADHQYLRAFRALFPTRLLRRAVAARGRQCRDRKLPLHRLLGVLLTWFFKADRGLPAVYRWLLPANHCPLAEPSLYDARGRLGWAPLRWLQKQVVGPLACPEQDPTAFYHGRRLLGIDGTTFTLADTAANERSFGRAKNQHGQGGYPLARVVAVCEVGTHALLDWVVRGYHRSEADLARRLLRRVPQGSLLLADRNFHSFELWQTAHGNYDLLIRVQKGPKLPVEKVLLDGSYLSRVYPRRGKNKKGRAIVVRVIRYQWTDEQGKLQQARLVTSLGDAQVHPAAALVQLYHRRWEHELVFKEIKSQLAGRPMQIRAKDPERVLQEVDALLLGHYTVRWVMLQAARAAKVAPVALSFQGTLQVLQVRLARVPTRRRALGKRWWTQWWEELLAAVGRQRLRPRQPRRCPRARKVTRSHWPTKKQQQEGTIPQLEVVPATLDSSS